MFESDGFGAGQMQAIRGPSRNPTLLEQLKSKQSQLRIQLDDIDAAIAALEKNPELAQILETVARAKF